MSIQTTDIHKTVSADDGIVFTASNHFWTIEPGVVVASDKANAVYENDDGSFLINHGSLAAGECGVEFDGIAGRIYNGEDGSISGRFAVRVAGIGVETINLGHMVGTLDGVLFVQSSSNGGLDNRGSIYGGVYGVVDASSHTGGTIANSGTIEGDSAGLWFATEPGLVTHVVNSGLITGGTFAIWCQGEGALDLGNSGTIAGDVMLAGIDQDSIVNAGTISGDVHVGGGDDSFDGAAGRSGKVYGEGGADRLTGGTGADRMFGGDGTDTLRGGLGRDVLAGGAGNDRFVFDTVPGPANRDTISDFVHLHDRFQLENAYFKGIAGNGALSSTCFWNGTAAHDASDHVVYNRATGALFYDSDGVGGHAAVQFATLTNKPLLTAHDFIVI